MEFVLCNIIEFSGKNLSLREVCSSWKNQLDANDEGIISSLYHKYNREEDLCIHDLILIAAQSGDIGMIYRLHDLYHQFLPVDWIMIAAKSPVNIRKLLISKMVPLERKEILNYCDDPTTFQDNATAQKLHQIFRNDSIDEFQDRHGTVSTFDTVPTKLAIMYGAKKIYLYLRERVDISVEWILLAKGDVLEEMCKEAKYSSILFSKKDIPLCQKYEIIRSTLLHPHPEEIVYSMLELALQSGFVSLIDKYLNIGNANRGMNFSVNIRSKRKNSVNGD